MVEGIEKGSDILIVETEPGGYKTACTGTVISVSKEKIETDKGAFFIDTRRTADGAKRMAVQNETNEGVIKRKFV